MKKNFCPLCKGTQKEKYYRAKYKCRLCGQYFYSGTETSNRDIAYNAVLTEKFPNSPSRDYPHQCSDGSIGAADFVGMECITDE